jgi:hypothetical protein
MPGASRWKDDAMATIAASKIVDGKLIADRVTDRIESRIEKGPMAKVDALVMHQTGSGNAASSFASYRQGKAGAHFLIDKDGTIYQSARTNQTCWHVGKLQSRCYALKSCSVEELAAVKGILFNKADSYSARLSKLNSQEQASPVPIGTRAMPIRSASRSCRASPRPRATRM